MIAITNVVAAQFENPLSIKGLLLCMGLFFAFFVLGGSAQVRSLSPVLTGRDELRSP
ncbi:hypothetical protein [Bradyrhizobium sp. cf659]|uniref:hypothetical protein n=1 Tax=Bradyrhizobium sp. cf659 TaxID=1761771 RepID=UPI0015A692EB|nr:hypothetical protein [Bradyrhizobium sp. cf659]